MKTEKEKMIAGELYESADTELREERMRSKELIYDYNHTRPSELKAREKIIRELFGSVGKGFLIEQPFHCDYGYNIRGRGEFLR